MNDDMQSRLQAYCARVLADRLDVRVSDPVRLSTGWESDIYSFVLEHGPAGERLGEELVLRIYAGADAHAKSAREFHGMDRLRGAGYPVPKVLFLERDDPLFDRPFVIMERVRGEVLWAPLFRSPPVEQQRLLSLFCELFVRLHSLDGCALAEDRAAQGAGDPYSSVDRDLDKLHPYLRRFPVHGLLPVVEWLQERRDQVPCPRPTPVHLDYHPANILLRQDGTALVIDWTQVSVSDPRFDLAWTVLLVSTLEGAEWRDRILGEYERLAGNRVEALGFFEVYACLKRLYSVAVSLKYGPETVGMRPEAAALMEKQMGATARVYDLLKERTGIQVAELDDLLATAGREPK